MGWLGGPGVVGLPSFVGRCAPSRPASLAGLAARYESPGLQKARHDVALASPGSAVGDVAGPFVGVEALDDVVRDLAVIDMRNGDAVLKGVAGHMETCVGLGIAGAHEAHEVAHDVHYAVALVVGFLFEEADGVAYGFAVKDGVAEGADADALVFQEEKFVAVVGDDDFHFRHISAFASGDLAAVGSHDDPFRDIGRNNE